VFVSLIENKRFHKSFIEANNQQERKNAAPPWSCGDSQCVAPSVSGQRKGG